ncbi:MAG TPA: lipocalin-like domain-containing protein [Candidatus Sulfotelmatobacter sp.]|nr:lipocalin-like domain-containing protein [Candidatus Sulfotelmatobacter sp.]
MPSTRSSRGDPRRARSRAGGQSAAPSVTAARFLGMWRLVALEGDSSRGPHPTGFIMYDDSGHMAVQVIPDTPRRRFSRDAAPTPEEAQVALTGYTAYFGRYTIDEKLGTVTHHREGSVDPGALGDVVRRYQFPEDDHLILMPVESQEIRLVWERLK